MAELDELLELVEVFAEEASSAGLPTEDFPGEPKMWRLKLAESATRNRYGVDLLARADGLFRLLPVAGPNDRPVGPTADRLATHGLLTESALEDVRAAIDKALGR
jgi:hypothetical protein